jgi:hypothetical protein
MRIICAILDSINSPIFPGAVYKMSKAITELKRVIKQTLHNLAQSGNASNQDVINYLRQNHPDLIETSRCELEDIAIRNISNNSLTRKSNIISNSEADMFGNKNGLKSIYSLKVGKEKKRFLLGDIKIGMLIRNLEDQDAQAIKEGKNKKAIEHLKELSNKAGTDELTYGEALKILDSNK